MVTSSVRDALAERLRTSPKITTFARLDPDVRIAIDPDAVPLDLGAYSGIIEFSPGDQVAVARSGTPLLQLQEELKSHGHCLPLPDAVFPIPNTAALHDHIAFNFPQLGEALFGTWRDWILGATVLRADGTFAKSGSMAVKSVAGYDAHKLFIGARGTLAIIVEVILRTLPLSAYSPPISAVSPGMTDAPLWIQRTLRNDFEGAVEGASGRLIGRDDESCTLWARIEPDEMLPRFRGDWILRTGCGTGNLSLESRSQTEFMERAKTILDPEKKLNPGEMGVF